MLNSFRSRNTCEQEARIIQDRLISVERNVAEFCQVFAQYSRKLARIRDKGDELAKVTLAYAESENTNKSLGIGLENLADSLSILSDYGEVRVQMIDSKVVGEFSRYDDICKQAKEEVKQIFNARDKEISRKRQLDRLRERTPRNRQQIVQAETELVKATAEVSKTIHNLEEKVTTFERQKLHDVKSILLDFISIEMGFHAKALQVLTKAYKDIDGVNEESDLEEFKKILRVDTLSHGNIRQSLFKAPASLGSLGAIFSTAHSRKTPGIPTNLKKMSRSDETLDVIKHTEITESEDSESENYENSESVTESTDKSPTTIKNHKGIK